MSSWKCEECYDTPWEYSVTAKVLGNSVKAVEEERDGSTEPVWVQRTADPRDSADYDVPWDLQRTKTTASAFKYLVQTRQDEQGSVCRRPMVRAAERTPVSPVWSQPTPTPLPGKTQVSVRGKPVTVNVKRRLGSSSSASPASSSDSSDRCSGTSGSSSRTKLAPTSLSSQTPSPKPLTPLLETAFCGKGFQMSPQEQKALAREEERNRLIQRLCHDFGVERQSSRRNVSKLAAQPAPAQLQTPFSDHATSCNKKESKSEKQKEVEDGKEDSYDIPWEFCNRKKLNRLFEKANGSGSCAESGGLSLDRKALSLNLGCTGLNPTAQDVDAELPLNEQSWYHGSLSRTEAESRLLRALEGSYLVRVCESNRQEFALSLKSAKGFMHMKIQRSESSKWILGYFSQPFDSIPKMIRYYSINKLPIKGAEHMCLLHPVRDQLL